MNQTTPLTRKQEAAIAALLVHSTQEAAAVAAGVSRITLYRWLRQEAFTEAYHAARREAFRHAAEKLSTRSTTAINALFAMVEDQATPATARVAAAKSVIELAYKLNELEDYSARVTRLERAVKAEQSYGDEQG